MLVGSWHRDAAAIDLFLDDTLFFLLFFSCYLWVIIRRGLGAGDVIKIFATLDGAGAPPDDHEPPRSLRPSVISVTVCFWMFEIADGARNIFEHRNNKCRFKTTARLTLWTPITVRNPSGRETEPISKIQKNCILIKLFIYKGNGEPGRIKPICFPLQSTKECKLPGQTIMSLTIF